MIERLKNMSDRISGFRNKIKSWSGGNKSLIFPFIFSFVMMFGFIEVTLIRNAMIHNFKTELLRVEKYLNEFQLDLAYDNIEFNNIFFHPLLTIDNLQIYNLRGRELWRINIPKVTARPGVLNINKLNFQTEGDTLFSYGPQSTPVSGIANLKITSDSQGRFNTLHFRMHKADIKDFAKIKEVSFNLRSLNLIQQETLIMPSLESHLEIRGIKLNGLLKYPLASDIQRIYAKINVMGSVPLSDSLHLGLETWLQKGGFIDIAKLIVNWKPLALVGQGTINFNEDLHPRINLNTSSKAMIELLNDLQENGFFDRKGVFVANILLNSKAFQLHQDDKYLTLTTPVSYNDNKLAVENITVKTIRP